MKPELLTIGNFSLKYSHLLVVGILILSFSTSFLIRILPGSYGWELNEFDPFFNFRATQFLLENGIFSYLSWHDDFSWYPEGRNISSTSQVTLHVFTALTYWIFGIGSNLYDFTIILPVVLGSFSTIIIFLLVRTIYGTTSGLISSLLFSISLPILLRGSLGWFKSEPLGILLGLLSVYLFLSGIKNEQSFSKFLRLIFAGFLLSFSISAWGGSNFFVIPLGIFIFIIPFINNSKSLDKKLLLFTIPVLFSSLLFERPGISFISGYLGMLLISSTTFSLLIIKLKSSKAFSQKKLIVYSIIILGSLSITFFIIDSFIFENQYAFRYLNAVNPFLTSTDPLVDSIAEHQSTSIQISFYLHTVLMIFSGFGIWLIFSKNYLFKENSLIIFSIIFGILGVFISSSFLRLELFASISLILFSSIGITYLIKSTSRFQSSLKRKIFHNGIFFTGLLVLLIIPLFLIPISPVGAMITPPTILNGGTQFLINSSDWTSTLDWIKNNTDEKSVILSWWDYGYWIQTLSARTTITDNATLNSETIKKTAQILMTNPNDAWKSLNEMEVDYIVIFVSATRQSGQYNGETLYFLGGGGDESKKGWIINIAGHNVDKFIHTDGLSGTDYFWNETLMGQLTPYSLLGYVNPNTLQDSAEYRPGTIGVYVKDIKFSENDPFKLVYASPSFNSEEPGPVLGVFVYQINKNIIPGN